MKNRDLNFEYLGLDWSVDPVTFELRKKRVYMAPWNDRFIFQKDITAPTEIVFRSCPCRPASKKEAIERFAMNLAASITFATNRLSVVEYGIRGAEEDPPETTPPKRLDQVRWLRHQKHKLKETKKRIEEDTIIAKAFATKWRICLKEPIQ